MVEQHKLYMQRKKQIKIVAGGRLKRCMMKTKLT